MNEITVQELKEKKESGDDFFLLDVREGFEYMVSNLDGENIPLGDLPSRVDEIKNYKDSEVVVMCRSGGRSGKALEFLEKEGFSNVQNLKGGITAWSKEIDTSMAVA
ncbi:MAG: rhodanese-like domain-containing protein [Balneola sp.]|jgi:rhodanese-related sulfurtransferase